MVPLECIMTLWLSQKGQGRLLKEVSLELKVEGWAGGVSQIKSRGKRCRQRAQHEQRSGIGGIMAGICY